MRALGKLTFYGRVLISNWAVEGRSIQRVLVIVSETLSWWARLLIGGFADESFGVGGSDSFLAE